MALSLNAGRLNQRGARPWLTTGLWLLLSWLLATPASATHIVGGHLRMTYLQGNIYRLGMTLYFDLINGDRGAIDGAIELAIYERTTNQMIEQVMVPQLAEDTLAYTNPLCQISTSPLRTSEINYAIDYTLSPARYSSPKGYYIVWERCCRNHTITNIATPEDVGQAFYLEFPALLQTNGQRFINSSPGDFSPVRDLACKNVPFTAPFSGTDADGDSLVYAMVTPLIGSSSPSNVIPAPPSAAPYATVTWLPGYDSLHQISGPQPLGINRHTGQLSFTAGQTGLYVFAVRCTEYRHGVRIGEVRREFQQMVVTCATNRAPDLQMTTPTADGGTLPYVPGTVYTLPDAPTERCLTLRAADFEANSNLTLSMVVPDQVNAPILGVTTGTVNPGGRPDTLTTQVCFEKCFGRSGAAVRMAFVVTDQACPTPRRDTVWLTVRTNPVPLNGPLPNVITPNGDGLNDRFEPALGTGGGCAAEFRRLRVFNRWGREVFATTDPQQPWRAEDTGNGLYYYLAEFSDQTYKGWVEVIR